MASTQPNSKPPRRKKTLAIAIVAVAVVALVIAAWALSRKSALPDYVVMANGRIEATEYDVATKLAGRLSDLEPHEGDLVKQDQPVGHIAAEEVTSRWDAARSKAVAAEGQQAEAQQNLRAAESDLELARANYNRASFLYKERATTKDNFDRNQSSLRSAEANVAAARAKVAQSRSSGAAARSDAESVGTNVEDAKLKSPVAGRVLYRLVEPGAMLAQGGKVLTVLDPMDMYITVFLPTDQAGKVQVGDEAVTVLDALPNERIPGHVRFVSPRNQFTPREVETHKEREKLMFRVKVYVDKDWLEQHGTLLNAGMPGVVYLRLDRSKPWPAQVKGSAG